MESSYWVHNIDPFFIKFPKTFIVDGIRWYGVAYLLGFLSAAGLLHFYYKKKKCSINPDQQISLMTGLFVGVLLGGRLGYILLYDWNAFCQNPIILIKFWEGGIRGMASHGGFLGVIIAALWFSRKLKINPLSLGDILVTLAPPGLFFGRIANFINGELWGKITDVSWAVVFPQSMAYVDYPVELIAPRHPSQLYEAILEGLLLFVFTQWRFWRTSVLVKSGHLCGEFFLAYGMLRIFVEMFREPDASLILGLSKGQFYSIFVIILGLLFIMYSNKKAKGLGKVK